MTAGLAQPRAVRRWAWPGAVVLAAGLGPSAWALSAGAANGGGNGTGGGPTGSPVATLPGNAVQPGATSTTAPGTTSTAGPGASGTASPDTGSTTTTGPSSASQAGGVAHENTTPSSRGSSRPAARPTGQVHVVRNGHLVAYGDRHIVYVAPPRSLIPIGQALYAQDCSSCHGTNASGTQFAPNLQGLGPATIDFWITTGRMPAKNPRAVQAPEKPPQLNDRQALAVAAYVNSLDPATPFIPRVNLKSADLSEGADLFSINCAACHTITGAGDALARNTFAPSLHQDQQPTPTQTAEAIRTGPANMPRFNGGNLTNAQVADITKYVVEKIQHPSNPGGFGLGGIGPVTEGFVGLLFGVGGLMVVCWWIGDRTPREEGELEHPEDESGEPSEGERGPREPAVAAAAAGGGTETTGETER